jgi:hypothetical protein
MTHRGWTDGVDETRHALNCLFTFEKEFIMNSKFIASAVIAAAGLVSVNAFAAGSSGGGLSFVQVSPTSTVSRTEVRAQALAAQQEQGPVVASNQVDGSTQASANSVAPQRARSEVRAEAAQAARSNANFNSAPGRA